MVGKLVFCQFWVGCFVFGIVFLVVVDVLLMLHGC